EGQGAAVDLLRDHMAEAVERPGGGVAARVGDLGERTTTAPGVVGGTAVGIGLRRQVVSPIVGVGRDTPQPVLAGDHVELVVDHLFGCAVRVGDLGQPIEVVVAERQGVPVG